MKNNEEVETLVWPKYRRLRIIITDPGCNGEEKTIERMNCGANFRSISYNFWDLSIIKCEINVLGNGYGKESITA